jgi:hypothetical protein
MSFPSCGFYVLILAAIMLFSMDSFLGFGYLSLLLFQKSLDWEVAYAPMLKRALGEQQRREHTRESANTEADGGQGIASVAAEPGSGHSRETGNRSPQRENDFGNLEGDKLLGELERGGNRR